LKYTPRSTHILTDWA